MNIKVVAIENLRQIQIDMIRRSFHGQSGISLLRGQGRILSILNEDLQISRAQLGEKMHMSRAALAELLAKMEKSGLITRTRSSSDKRRIEIKLTKAGKEAAEKSELERSDLPDMLDCLEIDELNQFNEYLEKIIKNNRERTAYGTSVLVTEEESAQIAENVVDSICKGCPGPESCHEDFRKYGHDRPNPDYCKYADQYPFDDISAPE